LFCLVTFTTISNLPSLPARLLVVARLPVKASISNALPLRGIPRNYTMLARAVQKHDASKPMIQSRDSAFASMTNNPTSLNKITLKSTLPSTLNTTATNKPLIGKNSLKRTASQMMHNTVENEPKFKATSAALYNNSLKRPASEISTEETSTGSGILNQMHDDVEFNESDFDDDLDLDAEDPIIPTDIKYPTLKDSSFKEPELPKQNSKTPTRTVVNTVASDNPIPWSSSPEWHKVPRQTMAQASSMPPQRSDHSVARPAKRRNLPWSVENTNQDSKSQTSKIAASKLESTKPQIPKSQSTKNTANPQTPAPKVQPWDKTASAIKQEQKAHREKANQSKKVVKGIKPEDAKDKDPYKNVARVFLSEEQKAVLDLVTEEKKSAFFTGSAGTGKSVLMREIIKALRKKYQREPDRVAVTASTGLAACNIGGVTLHSFAGIGLGKENAEDLIKKIKKNAKAKNRWLRTKVLIVDEISMVDGQLFDKLEKIARGIRNNGRPFGGIQLIVTGDFFQLPPVPDYGRESTFAFDAATWPTVMEHTICLTQVFRQKDPVFANMLNEMRVGRLSSESIQVFNSLSRKLDFEDDIEATELFPTRNEVDNSNRVRMQQLGGASYTFHAVDGGTMTDTVQRDKFLANCMAPQTITLKKGAQVMLIKNLDEGLVNGSIGKVIAFMDQRTYDHYLEDETLYQPVESAGLDNQQAQKAREKIKSFANKDNPANTSQLWPLVNFPLQDGSSRQLLLVQETWKTELPNGEVQASRKQVPLILAWALSIHKAQGQTLDRVRVDLGKVFEKGQAYVALSRATSREGLQIMRFDPRKVMAHEKVRRFYDGLHSVKIKGIESVSKEKADDEWVSNELEGDSLRYADYP
jgi:ATP-dependent DNA helicase PIF1